MAANPGPPPSTAQPQGGNTGDVELTTTDEVKEYCHEGDGENDEYLNSMDLHDIKSELEKDAEEAEVIDSRVYNYYTFTLASHARIVAVHSIARHEVAICHVAIRHSWQISFFCTIAASPTTALICAFGAQQLYDR